MITPRSNIAPPDVDLFDMDDHDRARNKAYCEELAAQMMAAELDPRNFFRRKGKRDYSLGHAAHKPGLAPIRPGSVKALR
jgi:hypothetical protein